MPICSNNMGAKKMLTAQRYCEASSAAGLQEAALAVVKDACCAGNKLQRQDYVVGVWVWAQKHSNQHNNGSFMQMVLNKKQHAHLEICCGVLHAIWQFAAFHMCCWLDLLLATSVFSTTTCSSLLAIYNMYIYDHVQPKESRGNCHELTKRIAKTGCSGKWPANVERDLMSALELPVAPWQAKLNAVLLPLALNLTGAVFIAELFCHIRVTTTAPGSSTWSRFLCSHQLQSRIGAVVSGQLRNCTLLKSPSKSHQWCTKRKNNNEGRYGIAPWITVLLDCGSVSIIGIRWCDSKVFPCLLYLNTTSLGPVNSKHRKWGMGCMGVLTSNYRSSTPWCF